MRKPAYQNVTKHYSSYGILGPGSFINYIEFTVLDNGGDTTISGKIIAGLDDTQVEFMNNIKSPELYMEVRPTFGEYPEFHSKVYRYVAFVDKETFLWQNTSGIYPAHQVQTIKPTYLQTEVKNKPILTSYSTIAKYTVNDSIEKDSIVTYQILELTDTLAIAAFGKEIKVIGDKFSFKGNLPKYRITLAASAFKIDTALSKEILYEVVSFDPVKE